MRTLLAKLAFRKAIGLYVSEQEVVISHVALTFLGPVELGRRSEPYEPDHLGDTIVAMLKPFAGRRHGFSSSVALGLSALRVFFSTRPIQVLNQDASPQVLLHEMLQSTTLNVDDMAVDVIRAKPGRRPVASVVSCRRRYLTGILSALESCGVRPYRAEPAPSAMLRVASHRHRAPRKARTVVRVFLGEVQCLAVLVAGDLPLIWRTFDLAPGEESATIASNILSLQLLGKYCGIEATPDLVMIHGRPDLAAPLGQESFLSQLPARTTHHAGPAFEPGAVALGLALGCQPTVEAFDLARTLKPRASIWEIFPWGELALQFAMLLCVTLFLNHHAQGQIATFRAVRSETAKHAWIKKHSDARLEAEKKELAQKVEVVHRFLDTRILWTTYTQDTARRLPEGILLKSLQGTCELQMPSKRAVAKTKKSFLLKLVAPIPQGHAMPKEIDHFLESLRGNPLLKRDFPLIELGDLKWTQATGKSKALADFTVVCLPPAAAKGAPGTARKAEPKKKGDAP